MQRNSVCETVAFQRDPQHLCIARYWLKCVNVKSSRGSCEGIESDVGANVNQQWVVLALATQHREHLLHHVLLPESVRFDLPTNPLVHAVRVWVDAHLKAHIGEITAASEGGVDPFAEERGLHLCVLPLGFKKFFSSA